jgi:hypothetical protein
MAPLWFFLTILSFGPTISGHEFEKPQIDPFHFDSANPGFPIPGRAFNASLLERFHKVDLDLNSTGLRSTSAVKFLTNSWKEDFSCHKDKKTVNVYGYRTDQCFGLAEYGSFMYHCDSGSFLMLSFF